MTDKILLLNEMTSSEVGEQSRQTPAVLSLSCPGKTGSFCTVFVIKTLLF